MVKVLDGCAINGRYWVFGSAGTDLNYSVNVTDMATGRERVYRRNRSNPLIGDVVSFPCRVPAGAAAGAFRAGESSTRAAKLLGEGHLPTAGAGPAPGLPLCAGPMVPDHLPEWTTVASREGQAPATVKRASTDRIHVIDIAFIYPSSITDRGKLRRNVDAAVAWANVAFLRSGVPTALRTVAVLQPDRRYGISLDGVGLSRTINRINGVLLKVRSDNGADLLYGLSSVENPIACGLARFRRDGATFEDSALYASTGSIYNGTDNDGCLGANLTLAHEVGHNLALVHNVENDSATAFISHGRGFLGENVSGLILQHDNGSCGWGAVRSLQCWSHAPPRRSPDGAPKPPMPRTLSSTPSRTPRTTRPPRCATRRRTTSAPRTRPAPACRAAASASRPACPTWTLRAFK